MSERASVFDAVDDFDVKGFAPKAHTPAPSPQTDVVRAAAEASSFRSRDPAPARVAPAKREPRRHRTGRNVQLNVKVRAETLDTFHQIADDRGWILAETLEKALGALQRELSDTPVIRATK
jgi:hypothetical protein